MIGKKTNANVFVKNLLDAVVEGILCCSFGYAFSLVQRPMTCQKIATFLQILIIRTVITLCIMFSSCHLLENLIQSYQVSLAETIDI